MGLDRWDANDGMRIDLPGCLEAERLVTRLGLPVEFLVLCRVKDRRRSVRLQVHTATIVPRPLGRTQTDLESST